MFTNVLAGWYLAEPQKMGPPTSPPQPAGGGDRNAIPLYDFPSQRVVHHFVQDMPIRVSALRTLGAYANVFALESFMDELAVVTSSGSGNAPQGTANFSNMEPVLGELLPAWLLR